MKKLIVSLFTMIATTMSFAQSSMLATLSHEGEISTFYGATALREAHNAAADGDIITLSSGTFVAVDITKGLTIRGAGMWLDPTTQNEPTVITGDFTIDIPTTATARLTMEGIYSNHAIRYRGSLVNATFIKDRFQNFNYVTSDCYLKNATFVHCKIMNSLSLYSESSASCVNCMIWNPSTYSSTTSNFEFVNCNLCRNQNGWGWDALKSSSFRNCILFSSVMENLEASNTAYNCIRVDTDDDFFSNMPNTTNTPSVGFGIFKDFTGGAWNDNSNFELTDEAKELYKGLDGTELGMYGGSMPFDITPTNPQITKCNVAAKSTADGKLSVDIEVNGAK